MKKRDEELEQALRDQEYADLEEIERAIEENGTYFDKED